MSKLLSTHRIHYISSNKDNHKLIYIGFEYTHKVVLGMSLHISQTERHYSELIVPIFGTKSSPGNVITLDPQFGVTRSKINLRKHTCIMKLVKELTNSRHVKDTYSS